MQSTAKRMEGDYWNFLVPIHFGCIGILLFVVINWIPGSRPFWQILAGFLMGCVVIFVLVKSLFYKPRFELHFLPNLNNALQHLTGEGKEALSKAKSGQYKTFTLLLIQYVFQKLSGCSKLSDGSIQRDLLCRQYGISNETLDAPLKNLLSKPYKEQTPKLQTQILDYFEEAKHYFDSLNSKEASALLEQIKLSLEQGKKLPL
jgi:hypothetical protein